MRFLTTLALVVLLLSMAVPEASATLSTNTKSCSQTSAQNTGGTFIVTVLITGAACVGPSVTVTDSNYAGLDVPAGSPFTVNCQTSTAGNVPPQAPTSIVINGYSDNSNLGGGGSPIWSVTETSCATAPSSTTFTERFTSDGTAGGTVKAGIVRLFVEMKDTNAGQTYDCNSDDAGSQSPPTGGACNPTGSLTVAWQGVARGNPGLSVPNLTSASGAALNTFVGSDGYKSCLTSNATAYASANRMTTFAKETTGGSYQAVGSAFGLSTGSPMCQSNSDVHGSHTTFPDGPIKLNWTESGGSSLTGFSGLSYWTMNAASVTTATVTNPNEIEWSTGDTLNRNLTGGCAVTSDGVSSSWANRGSTVNAPSCATAWQDARGNNIANGQNGQLWFQDSGNYESWADFGSVNTTFNSGSNLVGSSLAKDAGCASGHFPPAVAGGCATVTTGRSYVEQAQWCAAACTSSDANLLGIGNSTGLFDVNGTYNVTSITNSKTNLGANTSTFTISADSEFARVNGVTTYGNTPNVQGLNMTCVRVDSNGNQADSTGMGSTDASGNSAVEQFTVEAPKGTWTMTCTGDMNGNTASYVVTFTFNTAYTADMSAPVGWNVTLNASASSANGTTVYDVNVTSGIRRYDAAGCDCIVKLAPDQAPKITVLAYNSSSDDYDIKLIDRQVMRQEDGGTTYDYKFPANASNLTAGAFAYVAFNFSGAGVLGGQYYLLQENRTGNFSGNFTAGNGAFAGDAKNTTLEGQTHANATWCPYSCITTSEGYANATFCYRDTSADTGCVGNRWFNDTIAGYCLNSAAYDVGCVGNRYANATFEGQAHANVTWCTQANAVCSGAFSGTFSGTNVNTTWENVTYDNVSYLTAFSGNFTWLNASNDPFEGSAHANATWCPLTGAGCSTNGNFTGNFTGNGTGNFTGNFTGDVTGGNVTFTSLSGIVTLDFPVPFSMLLFFVLFLLFVHFSAPLPAGSALLAAMGQLLLTVNPSFAWSWQTGMMLVLLGVLAHFAFVLVTQVTVRFLEWNRRRNEGKV